MELKQSQEELRDKVEVLENKVENLDAENKQLKYELLQLKRRQDENDLLNFKKYNEADLKLGITKDNLDSLLWFDESNINEFELDYNTDEA